MGVEALFKLAFLVSFLFLVTIRVWFQRQAGAYRSGVADHARRHMHHEAKPLRVLRPLLGLPFYAVLFGWLFSAQWISWSVLQLPAAVRLAGVVLAGIALMLLWRSHAALGRHFAPTLEILTDHDLVMDGPYRWVRHPMYLAFLLLLLATGLLAANWFLGIVGMGLIVCVMVVRAPEEERLLRERFGEEYADYARRTGRYFPRIGH